MVRPIGYALIVAIPFLALVFPRGKHVVAGIALAPVIAGLLAVSIANGLLRDRAAPQNFGGLSLVGHIAPLIPSDIEIDGKSLGDAVAPIEPLRRLYDDSSGIDRHYWVSMLGWTAGFHGLSEAISKATPEGETDNDGAWQIAARTILARPFAYLELAAANFYGAWAVPAAASPEKIEELRDLFRANPDFTTFVGGWDRVGYQWKLVPNIVSLGAKVVGLGSLAIALFLVAFGLLFCRERPVSFLASYLALCVMGNHSLLALVQSALPRYVMTFWGLIIAFLILILAICISQRVRQYTWSR